MNWTSSMASETTNQTKQKQTNKQRHTSPPPKKKREDWTQDYKVIRIWYSNKDQLSNVLNYQDQQLRKLSLHVKAFNSLRYRILCEILLSYLGIDDQLWLDLTFKSSLLQTFAKHDQRYSAYSEQLVTHSRKKRCKQQAKHFLEIENIPSFGEREGEYFIDGWTLLRLCKQGQHGKWVKQKEIQICFSATKHKIPCFTLQLIKSKYECQ